MTSADLLALIADDTKQISYRPRWNSFTGGITSTILLQQIIYRWVHNGRKPFYKFNEPCNHPVYRPKDSWCEELGFSRRELETARNRIAAYTKGDLSLNTLVSYWRDADRKTWYALNEMAVMAELEALYPGDDETTVGIQGRLDLQNESLDLMAESAISKAETAPKQDQIKGKTRGKQTLMSESVNRNESQLDLMADSAISNTPKTDLMAESANSQCTNPPIANGGKRHYVLAESAICLNTKNTTKKTTKKTIKTTTPPAQKHDPPDDADFVVVLNWLGFIGDARREPLTAETALAWAFWLQLNKSKLLEQGKDPLAITIAAWRRAKSQPTADCLRLAKAWLAMSDPDRRLALNAVAQPLFEIQKALPQELLLFDIPTDTLSQLHRLTNGQFLPLELMPPDEQPANEPDAPQTAVSKTEPSDQPKSVSQPPPSYQMPSETAALWKDVLGELKLQMTKATFNTWLKDSKLQVNGGTKAVILVHNSYAVDWINGRMQDTIGRTLSAVAKRDLTIEAREEAHG